ncbi:hypothetical protein [Actinoallomurus soli]|uniref:hypothetical protein n=1 Tax=Actinoallomurus soli TaxID=2952535 RepID=UPI002092E098|nr:hypothetical protein [Actinoallomurus soli]MCO5968284.1 hypothetical protein [Actinoallomurus soli]
MPSAPRWRATEAAWEEEAELPPAEWGRRPPMAAGPRAVLGAVAVAGVLVAGRVLAAPHLREARVQGWATVFVAICVQALPFLARKPDLLWRRCPQTALRGSR